MIKTVIKDGSGSNKEATVDCNNSVAVTTTGVPPESLNTNLKPFANLMQTSAGATDMLVDGSVTNVDFYIQAGNDGDRYIQTIAFTIADAGATLNDFGNIGVLTNGCQLIYEDKELGEVVLADSLKTNFDFVQLCNFEPTFGSGTAAFRASNVVGTSEAFIPLLDITDVFGMPYGLKLPKGTNKKIILRIRDNVSTIDRFDAKCFGFDRID